MKKPKFLQQFELQTYEIPVLPEYVEFAVATDSVAVLSEVSQEKDAGEIVIVFRKIKQLNVVERHALKNIESTSIEDIMIDTALRSEGVVKGDDAIQALVIEGKVKLNSEGKKATKKPEKEPVTEAEKADKSHVVVKEVSLSDFFSEAEMQEIRNAKRMMFDNQRLAPVATYFVNNRIVDLESEKVVKFSFSQEQVQLLHPELYARILEFVGFELYGYPEDKAEKAEEATEEVIEGGKAKKALK